MSYNASICIGNVPYLPNKDFAMYISKFMTHLMGKTDINGRFDVMATDPKTVAISGQRKNATTTNVRLVMRLDASHVQSAIGVLNFAAFVPEKADKFLSRLVWAIPVVEGLGKDVRHVAMLDIHSAAFPGKTVVKPNGTSEHWRALLVDIRQYLRDHDLAGIADQVALQTTATNCRLVLPNGANAREVETKCPKAFRSTTYLARTLFVEAGQDATAGSPLDILTQYTATEMRGVAFSVDKEKENQVSITFRTKDDLYKAKEFAEKNSVRVTVGGRSAPSELDVQRLMVFVPEAGGMPFDEKAETELVRNGMTVLCRTLHEAIGKATFRFIGKAKPGRMLEVTFATQLEAQSMYEALDASSTSVVGIPKYTKESTVLGYCSFGIKGKKHTTKYAPAMAKYRPTLPSGQGSANRKTANAKSREDMEALWRAVRKHPSQTLEGAAARIKAPGLRQTLLEIVENGLSPDGNPLWSDIPAGQLGVRALTRAIERSHAHEQRQKQKKPKNRRR